MVCYAVSSDVTPEVAQLIAKKPFYRDGMRQIGALLPESDTEMHDWLVQSATRGDEDTFVYLLAAAASSGRELEGSLLPYAMTFRPPAWQVAWIAWRMKGNVTEEILHAMELTMPYNSMRELALFVAAAWWMKHRPGEELPRRILRYAREQCEKENLDGMDIAILSGFASWAARRRKNWQPCGRTTGDSLFRITEVRRKFTA